MLQFGEIAHKRVHYYYLKRAKAEIIPTETLYLCEQVLFVYVSTLIPPCLTDQRIFITVLIVTREPEQTTLLF